MCGGGGVHTSFVLFVNCALSECFNTAQILSFFTVLQFFCCTVLFQCLYSKHTVLFS